MSDGDVFFKCELVKERWQAAQMEETGTHWGMC
jgi:hypothetical protein